MSFMQNVLKQNLTIWDGCVATPFVQGLKTGSLPMEKFKQYMIQDSIYLKHYARVYGKAIYHATTLKEIQTYYSALIFVTDTESAIRLDYLKQFGLTDDDIEFIQPLPVNQSYIDFLVGTAEQGDSCEILMAVLPCMLSYSYVFRKIAAEPETIHSKYWDLIQAYASEGYFADCQRWIAFANEKCQSLSETEHNKLQDIFAQASLLELNFWNMAYQD